MKLSDHVSSNSLCDRLGIIQLADHLRWNRMRYFGHLKRMNPQTWPVKVLTYEVDGKLPIGRPKLRWDEVTKKDLRTLKLNPLL